MSKIYIVIGTEGSGRNTVGDELVKSFGYDNIVSYVHSDQNPRLFKIKNRPDWKGLRLLEKLEGIEEASDIIIADDWKATVDINSIADVLKTRGNDVQIIITKRSITDTSENYLHEVEIIDAQNNLINKFISDNNISPVYQPTNADSPMFVRNSITLSPITSPGTIEIAFVSLT